MSRDVDWWASERVRRDRRARRREDALREGRAERAGALLEWLVIGLSAAVAFAILFALFLWCGPSVGLVAAGFALLASAAALWIRG